ncbi:rho GTPase-activating protein 15-like [Nelusetta ayraudi]|uniref:rho GTPase-activating protein 15-like n=1 Tax=Nelusetta ayraudi TaxID=303726 RepID=UPI003F6E6FCE
MATSRTPGMLSTAKPSLPQQAGVQLRVKTSGSPADRLSQSRSMVLQDPVLQKPVTRHRRNQSQHDVLGSAVGAEIAEPLLRGEHLNMTRILEGGRKLRKNWTSVWSILTSEQLLLYKEEKKGSKADTVQLCGAVIGWTMDKSSRKNVFQITTSTGNELLLQVDNYSTALKWYDAIKTAIHASTRADVGSPLRRSSSTEYLPRHGSLPGRGSASPSAKQRNSINRRSINMFGSSKLKHSSSDSSDRSGVKNRLKKFIIRRPSMKTLQEKGLIQDRVFGCQLSTLCEREGSTVPRFLQACVDAVDKRGLQMDGIYRISGNLATIQKLRFIVDQEEPLDLDHSQWEDIHVVAGALKLFFRELPEPLFPSWIFQQLVETLRIKEDQQKIQAVKKLVQQLPPPNLDTMKVLFSHLLRVLAFSTKNLMSAQSLSIVFGPTLMWTEQDAGNMAVNMVYQNQIVEFILIESRQIFGLDRK